MEQINKIQSDISMLPSKQQLDLLQGEILNISRIQSHLQKKQDQLASKQDLLYTRHNCNERQRRISIMSSPLSPPLSSWNEPFLSISSFAELPSHKAVCPNQNIKAFHLSPHRAVLYKSSNQSALMMIYPCSILNDITRFGPSSPIRSSSLASLLEARQLL